MNIKNNELQIYRGESFTYDVYVVNKDGSPYIISNQLLNPEFVITISNTSYEQSNRYIYKRRLKLTNYPKFYFTQPINLRKIYASPEGESGGGRPGNVSDFSEISELQQYVDSEGNVRWIVTEGYYNGEYVLLEPSDAVFYVEYDDGSRKYKYWDTLTHGWQDYECRIITAFNNTLTKEWVEQEYVYSIRLIDVGASELQSVEFVILKPSKLVVFNNITQIGE